MPKKPPPAESALYVRLPSSTADKLDRAAEVLGMRKKDLVAGLVSKYVDPDSGAGLNALGFLSSRKVTVDLGTPTASATRPGNPIAPVTGTGTMGSYSFQAYDLPEVMNSEQAAQFLQIYEATVIELAESDKLPGRKLGTAWRFSQTALVAWLSTPEKR